MAAGETSAKRAGFGPSRASWLAPPTSSRPFALGQGGQSAVLWGKRDYALAAAFKPGDEVARWRSRGNGPGCTWAQPKNALTNAPATVRAPQAARPRRLRLFHARSCSQPAARPAPTARRFVRCLHGRTAQAGACVRTSLRTLGFGVHSEHSCQKFVPRHALCVLGPRQRVFARDDGAFMRWLRTNGYSAFTPHPSSNLLRRVEVVQYQQLTDDCRDPTGIGRQARRYGAR